jgi:hypothetical protein
MDTLLAGGGVNMLAGGLDADVYVTSPSLYFDEIVEGGGVDRIDLSHASIDAVTSIRSGSDLVLDFGASQVLITNHFVASGHVEQFTFAEGTFAAGKVEYMTGGGGGGGGGGEQPAWPVLLDLDGDGLELVGVGQSKARFDVDGDGAWERMGWVGADDGILVLDRDGNGRINGFREISYLEDFLGASTDFEGLYGFDSDHDGFLTAADARFSEFQVWVDANGNGRSEDKELFSLQDLGIKSLNLEALQRAPYDSSVNDNQIVGSSYFQRADGTRGLLGDVAFYVEEHGNSRAFAAWVNEVPFEQSQMVAI